MISLRCGSGRHGQARQAADLMSELNSLHHWMQRDIEKFQAANTAEMSLFLDQVNRARTRSQRLRRLLSVLASLGFFAAFILYIRRAVIDPSE